MTVLSDVVQQVVAELGFGVTGVATGGSTTTLIDTKLLDRYSENYFDEGTLLVVYDAGGASAAPQGEWGVVSNFNNQNNTVTINAALTTAIAAGDVYVLASARFQLYEIIDAVNRATKETGDVETVNSSNTVVAAQLEYTLPAATTTVTKVEYNTIVGDANWLGLEEITGWEVRKAASGSAGTLVVVYDAGGLAAAPQGEWGVVSNFNNQNNTVTINAALTAAIAAGDVYVLASSRFQLYEIIDAVNRATKEAGDVETVNSSNTVVAAQLEYTLPAATTTVTKVEYNTVVGDSDDLGLLEITGWEVRKAASGTAGTLVLPYLPPVGRTLYITYTGKHPARFTAAGVIDDRIDLAALALRSAIILVERKLHQPDPDPQIKAQLDTLRERYAEVRSLQEPAPQRQVRLFTHHLNSAASTRTKWWSN